MNFQEKIETAAWIGKSLFDRGKVNGSSANMSFLHDNKIYITGSGTCFGRLDRDSFSCMSTEGELLEGRKPSKEFPLHQMMYKNNAETGAVLHTHSTYATLWSCIPNNDYKDTMAAPTPYLKMRVGQVQRIPFRQPGSEELFELFQEKLGNARCFLLEKHGPIVGSRTLLDAFYDIEELEETANILCHLTYLNNNAI